MTWDSIELAAIEEGIWNDLDTLSEDGELKASEQTAFVRTTTGQVGAKTHDLEETCVHALLVAIRNEHPHNKVQLTFGARTEIQAPRKRKHANAPPANSSDAPSTSGIPSSPPPNPGKKTRTSRLQEQNTLRLDKIQHAGDFHAQLARQYQREDKGCINLGNFCFPDPQDRKFRYVVNFPQHQQ